VFVRMGGLEGPPARAGQTGEAEAGQRNGAEHYGMATRRHTMSLIRGHAEAEVAGPRTTWAAKLSSPSAHGPTPPAAESKLAGLSAARQVPDVERAVRLVVVRVA